MDDFHTDFGVYHDALNRMRDANKVGRGCYLTAEMVRLLGLSELGQRWEDPDPRDLTGKEEKITPDPHSLYKLKSQANLIAWLLHVRQCRFAIG